MLLEIAIGDAYGAGFEYADSSYVRAKNNLVGYVRHPRHGIRPGHYTDDTQMSLAIAELILSGQEWNKANIMNKELVTISKLLSLVLRHEPQKIGIALDAEGWVLVDELLAAAARHGRPISQAQLAEVVATNDKRRFSFSPDGRRIRANQGHSVEVELGLVPVEPPELLYHGTVDRFLKSIREKGLLRGNRHHVHLSADRATAARVGQRRGRPLVLVVEAARMHRDGHRFFRSENGVWLAETVPPQYLREGEIRP